MCQSTGNFRLQHRWRCVGDRRQVEVLRGVVSDNWVGSNGQGWCVISKVISPLQIIRWSFSSTQLCVTGGRLLNNSVTAQLVLLLRVGHWPGNQRSATTFPLKGKWLAIYCDKDKSPHKEVDNKRKQSVTTNPQNCIFLLKDPLKWLNSHSKNYLSILIVVASTWTVGPGWHHGSSQRPTQPRSSSTNTFHPGRTQSCAGRSRPFEIIQL